MDASVLGDDVQNLNTLSVIASESYEKFVSDLQNDMKENLRERPVKVDIDVFNEWASSVAELRGYAESVMENVESALKDVESIVTEESIRQEVMDILESKYGNPI